MFVVQEFRNLQMQYKFKHQGSMVQPSKPVSVSISKFEDDND